MSFSILLRLRYLLFNDSVSRLSFTTSSSHLTITLHCHEALCSLRTTRRPCHMPRRRGLCTDYCDRISARGVQCLTEQLADRPGRPPGTHTFSPFLLLTCSRRSLLPFRRTPSPAHRRSPSSSPSRTAHRRTCPTVSTRRSSSGPRSTMGPSTRSTLASARRRTCRSRTSR